MTTKERLRQLVEEMPEEVAEEMLRYAEAQLANPAFPPKKRVSGMGMFAGSALSSEEFMRRKTSW